MVFVVWDKGGNNVSKQTDCKTDRQIEKQARKQTTTQTSRREMKLI